MREPLFNGSDAPGVFAFDDVPDFLREGELPFIYDFSILDDIYRNVMVYERQYIQIQGVNVAFHFQDILFPLFIASGIFNNSHRAVQFIQL